MSGYRCTATTEVLAATRAAAETIGSPRDGIDWTSDTILQCLIEDVAHDFHAAFLRTGARENSDVFLCWTDGSPDQSLADLDCCLGRRTPMGTGCTIFAHHPGLCEWAYIDPPYVAVTARADQLLKELGL
ncbi:MULTISPECIES: hypothetical protein [Streptomyces]|uniref:hypothetical protein n=1 Tax=Streptomyces TaxID=1883 RepID=UPI0004C7CB2C|nr:hypothetical protein [Streptomyces sp. NRRL F-5650]